ncbi:MAG: hypothetical protein ABSG67_06630 [Thermoguttaceae bacterium]|jgi:hypothetical protein
MKTQKKYRNNLLLMLLFIGAYLSRAGITLADDETIDYAKFKEPPAEYRGICWMHFNLSNMSEDRVVAGVQANVKRDSWGSFMIESSGGSTSGLSPMWPVKMGRAYDGALTYLHKVKDGRDIYFFANSTDKAVDTKVALRGDKKLAVWNIHIGEKQSAEVTKTETDGQPVSTVYLVLPPVTSTFFVQE